MTKMRKFLGLAIVTIGALGAGIYSAGAEETVGSCIRKYGHNVLPEDYDSVSSSCRMRLFPNEPDEPNGLFKFAKSEVHDLYERCLSEYGAKTNINKVLDRDCRVLYFPRAGKVGYGNPTAVQIGIPMGGGLY